jgi:tellurite resistance protein
MPTSDMRRPLLPTRMLLEEMDVFRSSQFMEAMVAAYAIVAHADGEVAPAERRRLMSLARHEPLLAAFSRSEIAEELAIHEANFELDNEVAGEMAVEKLEPMRDHPREARAIVEAAKSAIPADGIAHPAEFRALAKIRLILRMQD